MNVIEEELMLGLRTMKGVSRSAFHQKFSEPIEKYYANEIESLISRNLLVLENDFLKLTHKGKFLGNEVFQEFLFN